jgi:hypothetical protein
MVADWLIPHIARPITPAKSTRDSAISIRRWNLVPYWVMVGFC